MDHTSNIILEKIEKEQIRPRSKGYFLVRHMVLWVPYVVVTALGTVAVAGIMYAAKNSGWEYREFVYPTFKDFVLTTAPVIWLASLIVFSVFVVKALRTTHQGYRFSLKTIMFGSFLMSIVLGALVYGIDSLLDADSFIRYPVHKREKFIWNAPQEGRLLGVIEEDAIEDSNVFSVRTPEGELWVVDASNIATSTPKSLGKGESVRFVGTTTGNGTFIACLFLPWQMGGMKGMDHPPLPMRKEFHRPMMSATCKEIMHTLKKPSLPKPFFF